MKHVRPKTIDGVPIRAGMVLFFRSDGKMPFCERVKSVQNGVVRSDYAASIFRNKIIVPSMAYSSYDAAQAAGIRSRGRRSRWHSTFDAAQAAGSRT